MSDGCDDMTLSLARNGVVVEVDRGKALEPPTYVFNDPDALGRFVADWARANVGQQPADCKHADSRPIAPGIRLCLGCRTAFRTTPTPDP